MAYAIIQYRNTMNGGCITYGRSLGCGFLVGMFAAVVTSVYTFIFLQYINPDYITEILAKAEDQMLVQNPNMTQEQIDMGLSYAKMFAKPWLSAITGFVSMSFVSLLFSLLVSIFTQKVDNSKNTSEIR